MRYTREFNDKLGYEVVKSKLKSKVSETHCASKQKKFIKKKNIEIIPVMTRVQK
jgi:hypothetical protein